MAEQSLTTQVTASTEVARPAPVSPAPMSPWTACVIVFGGALAIATFANCLLAIIDRIRTWRKDDEKAEDGELDALRGDLRALEATTRDFMPKSEIATLVQAERGHRLAGDDAAARLITALTQRAGESERQITRLGTLLEGQAAGMLRIEQSVEKLGNRMDEKIDRLTDLVKRA